MLLKNQDYKERIQNYLKKQFFMHHLDFDLNVIEPGCTEGILEVKPFHFQQFGRVHGGVIATVADCTAGFAAYTLVGEADHVVTGEIKVSYFAPGFGPQLRVVGKVIKAGRKIHFCESEVFNIDEQGNQKLIAKASTSMIVISEQETKS